MKAFLLLLTAGKFGKLFISAGSMVLSIFTYSIVYGWKYAFGFVGLIFVHELGHFFAARQRKLNVGLPTFIPFVGAWIELKEQPLDAETEAYVGLAGSMFGSAAAFIIYLLSIELQSKILLALSYGGFMINLFNLIPLSPLDGGRIVSVISPKIWLLGMPILVALFLWNHSPLVILIAIIAAPHLWSAVNGLKTKNHDYYKAKPITRIKYGFQYLALIAFLTIFTFEIHSKLE